jgi:hypothetical protein
MKAMHKIDDDVRANLEPRQFQVLPGGVQATEDVIGSQRPGHGAGFTGFGLGSIVPETRVLELPFMFENQELTTSASKPTISTKAFDEKGSALGWTDGFVICSAPPVRPRRHATKMVDLVGRPAGGIFFKAFRIAPIPLAAPDVLTSLQTGVIDAVYASPLACVALQWYSRVKFMATCHRARHQRGHRVQEVGRGVGEADRPGSDAKHRRSATKTRVQNNGRSSRSEGVRVVRGRGRAPSSPRAPPGVTASARCAAGAPTA